MRKRKLKQKCQVGIRQLYLNDRSKCIILFVIDYFLTIDDEFFITNYDDFLMLHPSDIKVNLFVLSECVINTHYIEEWILFSSGFSLLNTL